MKTFKGTKGEWMASSDEVIAMPSQIKICRTHGVSMKDYDNGGVEHSSNTKLIAAAPELLEVALEVVRHFNVVSETQDRKLEPWEVHLWEISEKAINKAL